MNLKLDLRSIGRFEKIVLFIFLYTIVSGALRKWIFDTGTFGNYIFLSQLISPYVLLLSGKKYVKPWKDKWFLFFLCYLIISALNPKNLTIYHGVFGILLNLNFLFLSYYYLLNRDLINFKPILIILIICCASELVLSIIQYQLPSTHWLNSYADQKLVGRIALVGDSVRVTGTFSYLSGYTSFIVFLILFIWYLFRIRFNETVITVFFIIGLFSSFMSGARQAVGAYLIISLLIIYEEVSFNRLKSFLKSLIIPSFTLILFFIARGSFDIEQKLTRAFLNFNERREFAKNTGEEEFRIFWDANDLFNFKGDFPVFGVGLGSTYQGATTVFGLSDYVKDYGYYENELSRIVLEGGFLLLFLRLYLIFLLYRRLKMNFISRAILFLLFFYFIPTVFNIYNSILIFIGLALVDSGFNNKSIKL